MTSTKERQSHRKDKRHRSSSSIAGVVLDGTLSERKIDIKASIPEVDDQFAIAEARCEDLQEKIDLVKILKKRRKLKKRSTTRILDQQKINVVDENVPFISVRTQPKKKLSQHAARGYKYPDVIEEQRIISENAGMHQNLKENQQSRLRSSSGRPSGDGTCGRGVQITHTNPMGLKFEDEDKTENYYNNGRLEQLLSASKKAKKKLLRRRVPRKFSIEDEETDDKPPVRRQGPETNSKLLQHVNKAPQNLERPVVELFNKNHGSSSAGSSQGIAQMAYREKARDAQLREETAGPEGDSTPRMPPMSEVARAVTVRRLRRVRRGYEQPTVASRLKQTVAHVYVATTNSTRLPFVVTKSTAPSHNIGVNIQQVLNGLKTQQPLLGIPTTIAHHMGFRQCAETKSSNAAALELGSQDLNSIQLGRQLLNLPMQKVSYKRLLQLFREGDGIVPRFLSAVSRPRYSLSDYRQPYEGNERADEMNPTTPRASASVAGHGYRTPRFSVGDALQSQNCTPFDI